MDLLGRFRLERGTHVIERFYSQKVALLLAYLAFYPDRAPLREELTEIVWPGVPPKSGRSRLSQSLFWLRPHLEPEGTPPGSVLLTDRNSVRLNPDAIVTDVAAFRDLRERARRAPSTDIGIDLYARALHLYQGDLLPGFYDVWALEERERLAAERLDTLRRLARLHRERGGDGDDAIAEEYARQAVAADPTQEESHLELIRALTQSGRIAAALRQYHDLVRILAEHLDEEPSPEAQELAARIRQRSAEPAVLSTSQPASRLAWSRPLVPITRFFGREDEITRVMDMVLSGTRLITLLGMGGSGKTRLATEATARLAPVFGGAIAFVPLADLTDPRHIPLAIADALRLERGEDAGGEALERIGRALAPLPRALILLDNMEHLTDDPASRQERIAKPLRRLLEEAPGLTILTTSRHRLGVTGERELSVMPLPTPEGGDRDDRRRWEEISASPSVQLFVDRAQAVRPSFRLTEANAEAVLAICERLEGIPLAIELCAAWAVVLSPAQMQERLGDRFRLLIARHVDMADRHRSLRAAIEYSVEQLPADLRETFASLSVFRGGWTLEAAAAVCERDIVAMADAMASLRERSLIVSEESEADDTLRYRMLETLREFAEEERSARGEGSLLWKQAGFFLHFAEKAERFFDGPEAAVWLARLEAEHDNLRAALQWYLDAVHPEEGLRLAGALCRFWETRGEATEGAEWIRRLIALPGSDRTPLPIRARAMKARVQFLISLAEYTEARGVAEEALALFRESGDDPQITLAMAQCGLIEYRLGETVQAERTYERSLARARAANDQTGIVTSLSGLARLHYSEKQWERARALYQEALSFYGDRLRSRAGANVLGSLGLVARYLGEYSTAQEHMQEAMRIHREIADKVGIAVATLNLGTIARLRGDYDAARAQLQSALTLAWDAGYLYVTAWGLKELGHLSCAEGDWVRGVRLLGAADRLRESRRFTFKPADPDELEQEKAAALAALGEDGLKAAWEAGRTLPLAAAVAEAREK